MPAASASDARPSLALSMVQGSVATGSATVFTNPLEVAKTRFQLSGELGKAPEAAQRGVVNAMRAIWRAEGLRGVQAGLGVGVGYSMCMNGTRLGTYVPIQGQVASLLGVAPSDAGIGIKIVSAATSGALGALFGSPLFLIKVRLQGSGAQTAAGHNYSGAREAITSIYKTEGLRGFARGVEGAMLRVAVGSGAQLSTYDVCQKMVADRVPDGTPRIVSILLGSFVSGLAVTTAMNPFDVVSTRLYNQGNNGWYSGPFDCIAKTVRAEGFMALYRGWMAHYWRLGPHSVLTFLFWEFTKEHIRF